MYGGWIVWTTVLDKRKKEILVPTVNIDTRERTRGVDTTSFRS